MHIGKTYLNCFKFLLQLPFLVDRNFLLLLTNLHLGLPIFIQLVVGILRENDKPQDIRTHKYHATCVRHTAPVSKCTHKFPTVKEVTDEYATFSSNVLLITDTARGLTVIDRGSIHERARYLPFLHTKTGFWAT